MDFCLKGLETAFHIGHFLFLLLRYLILQFLKKRG